VEDSIKSPQKRLFSDSLVELYRLLISKFKLYALWRQIEGLGESWKAENRF
jgi:hypothetical protein